MATHNDDDVPRHITDVFEIMERWGAEHPSHGQAPSAYEYPDNVWPSDGSDEVPVFVRLSNRTEALPTGD